METYFQTSHNTNQVSEMFEKNNITILASAKDCTIKYPDLTFGEQEQYREQESYAIKDMIPLLSQIKNTIPTNIETLKQIDQLIHEGKISDTPKHWEQLSNFMKLLEELSSQKHDVNVLQHSIAHGTEEDSEVSCDLIIGKIHSTVVRVLKFYDYDNSIVTIIGDNADKAKLVIQNMFVN